MEFVLGEEVTRAQGEGADDRLDMDVLVGCTSEPQLVEAELFESMMFGVEERIERVVGCFAVTEGDSIF